jgi:hypothetical protein
MPRTIRRISAVVYGLGIIGALAFGANEALGRAVYSSCLYMPPTHLGACINSGDPKQDSLECVSRCGDEYYFSRCAGAGYCCVCIS